MKYRLLEENEYGKLAPIFGSLAPLPGLSYVGILDDNGQIRAVMNVHIQLHLDHFWIDPEAKVIVDWRKLWDVVENRIPKQRGLRVYAAPTFKNGERMGEILGFDKPKVPVMVKEY